MEIKISSFLSNGYSVSSHNSDFADRDKAVKLITKTFGEENVLPVSNFNQLQLRSLIKDVSRFYDIPFDEVNAYTAKFENEALAEAKKTPGFDRAGWVLTYDEAEENSPSFREFMAKYPDLEITVKVLFKQFRNISRHAGGVLITENGTTSMPVIKASGDYQTPWPEGLNARHLEYFGFLKFDILGLGTLRMIEECIRRILKKDGVRYAAFEDIYEWYYKNLHPDNNNMADLRVYKNVYWNGKFAGVFQFVNPPVQRFIQQMKPRNIIDLAVATSIFRPGPLCLSGDTEILIGKFSWNNGGVFHQHKSIKQLYDEWNNKSNKRYKYKLTSFDETNKTLFQNNIKNVWKSGTKDVYALKTRSRLDGAKPTRTSCEPNRSNYTCKATMEHRFLTNNGWKQLKDIQIGEYIYCLNRNTEKNKDARKQNRKHVWGQKNFKNIAFYNYEYSCIFCDWNEGSLDCNHVSGNRFVDNSHENLSWLCPNHHRQYSEGKISEAMLVTAREAKKLFFSEDVRMIRYEGCEYIGKEETYDIEVEGPNHNFFAGGFVVHNSLGVDKQYLKNRKNPDNVQYDHPLIKEVLGPTSGLLVFQEQLMQMYNVLAGVPLAETDSVRKAFTKKDLSNKEKAFEARQKLRNEFIEKCHDVNGIGEDVSGGLFDDMEALVAYSFNKSHAVSYAMISYMCAWLLTYYPNEWVASYIDYCSTEKGNVTGKESAKSVAIKEAMSLGYKVGKPDINLSERGFQIIDNVLTPSFSSIKGVGAGAIKEIMDNRPYRSVVDILFDSLGNWRHSKFNKTALSALIKLEALDSMNLVGPNKQFKNYRQLHHVLVEKADVLKRAASKKKKTHIEDLYDIMQEAQALEDWTLAEKIEFSKELAGSVDLGLIVTPEIRDYLHSQNIDSIDNIKGDNQLVWAVVRSSTAAKTKTGKNYLKMSLVAGAGVDYKIFCWNYNPAKDKPVPENSLIVGKFKQSDFGLSCFYGSLEVLSLNNDHDENSTNIKETKSNY